MLGALSSLAGSVVDSAVDTVSDFVEDPIGKTAEIITQPLRNGLEVVEGLTEGELRVKAAASLGVDAVAGMPLSELIEWYDV